MKSLLLSIGVSISSFALFLPSTGLASDILTEVNDELVVTESKQGALTINWEKPRDYTDVRRSNGNANSKKYRHSVFKRIHSTFEDLIETLPQNYTMQLVVTNLDLAGDTRANGMMIGSGLEDVRVMRQIDIPRISFSYEIKDASGELVSGESVDLKDMNYLQGASRINSSKPLFYEQRMLSKWFKREFKDVTLADS